MIPFLMFATYLTPLTCAKVAPDELTHHQGTWVVTSFIRDGVETPAEIATSIVRVVEGDHVVWKRAGKSFAGTSLVLDPTTIPKSIDVMPDGGPSKDKRVLGIYQLEAEILTICMASPDQPRPKAFRAEKGTGQTLMVFRREPAKR